MRLSLTIEVDIYDDLIIDPDDEILWMENEILVGNGTLLLHSNEIGCPIGEIKNVSNIQWLQSSRA